MNATHDWSFQITVFGPDLPAGVSVINPPFPTESRRGVLESIRQQVLSDKQHLRGDFTVSHYPPLTILIEKTWQTAAVVQFVRPTEFKDQKIVSGTLPALAILLTGIDRADDDAAIARAMARAGEADLPLTASNVHRMRETPRPLAVIIHESALARHDPVISFIFTATAQAYFQQFGSEGDERLNKLPPYPGP